MRFTIRHLAERETVHLRSVHPLGCLPLGRFPLLSGGYLYILPFRGAALRVCASSAGFTPLSEVAQLYANDGGNPARRTPPPLLRENSTKYGFSVILVPLAFRKKTKFPFLSMGYASGTKTNRSNDAPPVMAAHASLTKSVFSIISPPEKGRGAGAPVLVSIYSIMPDRARSRINHIARINVVYDPKHIPTRAHTCARMIAPKDRFDNRQMMAGKLHGFLIRCRVKLHNHDPLPMICI